MVYGEDYPSQGTTPARCIEHHSRRRVESHERPLRLDAMPRQFPLDQPEAGPSGGGPVCQKANPPNPSVGDQTHWPCQDAHPDSLPDIIPQLTVWVITGSATRTDRFRTKLQRSSWHHGGIHPPKPLIHTLESGQAGAVNGTVIPYHAL